MTSGVDCITLLSDYSFLMLLQCEQLHLFVRLINSCFWWFIALNPGLASLHLFGCYKSTLKSFHLRHQRPCCIFILRRTDLKLFPGLTGIFPSQDFFFSKVKEILRICRSLLRGILVTENGEGGRKRERGARVRRAANTRSNPCWSRTRDVPIVVYGLCLNIHIPF